MYRRAPYVLHRLEERIGPERADRFLVGYMTENVRTTSELLARLREIAGSEAEEWFRGELAKGPSSGGP